MLRKVMFPGFLIRLGARAVVLAAILAAAPAVMCARSSKRTATTAPAAFSASQVAPTNAGKIVRKVIVINVPVSVLNKRGFPVIDLTRKDFEVFEDGKRQSITYFRQEPLPPLRIGLVLDTSNSMKMQMKFERDAASEFVYNILAAQNARNKIFLETFDESSNLVQDFTSDPDLLNTKIRSLKAGGGKALYDAIYNACEKMLHAGPPEDTRRLLVVISDGLDVQSKHTMAEAISMAHRAETAIYTIGNSTYGFANPGDKYLRELAEDTGGGSFFPLEKEVGADLATGYLSHGTMDPSGYENIGLGARSGIYTAERLMHLSDALQSLGRELHSQYSIGYTPTDQNLDGTYRRIRVVVRRRDVKVRYKTGYFALANR